MAALCEAGERHGWRRTAVEDPVTGTLSYGRLVMGANILARKLMPLCPEGKAIGVMLPNANAAAATFFALNSSGRVPAMINFSAGAANILAACRAAEVTRILTSRAFIEKGRLGAIVESVGAQVEIVYLEDVRATVTTLDKIRGFLAPRAPLVARRGDDLVIEVADQRRVVTLPSVLRRCLVQNAEVGRGELRIRFERDAEVWASGR